MHSVGGVPCFQLGEWGDNELVVLASGTMDKGSSCLPGAHEQKNTLACRQTDDLVASLDQIKCDKAMGGVPKILGTETRICKIR